MIRCDKWFDDTRWSRFCTVLQAMCSTSTSVAHDVIVITHPVDGRTLYPYPLMWQRLMPVPSMHCYGSIWKMSARKFVQTGINRVCDEPSYRSKSALSGCCLSL